MSAPHTAGRIVRKGLSFEQRGFTRIPNDWVRDKRLSYRSRGIMTFLMSHEAGWSITLRDLAADARDTHETSQEGLSAVRTAVNELERWGYIARERTRDARGRLGATRWVITDPWERRGAAVDNSRTPPLIFDGDIDPGTGEITEKPGSAPECDSPTLAEPTLDSPTQGEPTQGEPTQGERTTTEEHSSEEQDQKTNARTPTGPVENVSTGARSAASQNRPSRCTGSAAGIHHPHEETGWCINACGLRLDPITGVIA